MSYYSRISKAFEEALKLPLNQNSKYVVFSDCHRGAGRVSDDFLKNKFIYMAALKHYFSEDFTYIELGDGDELWENRSFDDIKNMYPEVFELLSRYYHQNRFYAVYGNHDIVKKDSKFTRKYLDKYYCDRTLCHHPLFPGISFYSGIIISNREFPRKIYLTHGHQADFFNSTLWPVSRFLVRYIWQPLEFLGIPDPTSAAQNNTKKKKSEKLLTSWAQKNSHILITGHTHNPMIGTPQSPYFNTGSCVSPTGITCIEIENNCITLVKWSVGTKFENSLYVSRSVLGEKVCLDDY